MRILTTIILVIAVVFFAWGLFELGNRNRNVPMIVRDLALEREVRALESELRDQQAWSRTCWNLVEKNSSQLKECRRQCFFMELGS